ncbi:MAG: hypothetical protein ABIQ12_14365 [Opitutaceae bacterium]
MLRALLNLCLHLPFRFGRRRAHRGRFSDPRFVSFMPKNNRRTLDTDLRDAVLQGRKVMKNCLRLGVALGAAWVVLESARALSVY